MNKESKTVIMYHRSHRALFGSTEFFLLGFFFCALPFSVITLLFYPQITHGICLLTGSILAPIFSADMVRLVEMPFIYNLGNVSFLRLPGNFPTVFFSMVNALVCLVLFVLLQFINRAKPMVVFLMMIVSVHFAASLFFIFFPARFPYDVTDYSQLYMMQQIGIWFFVPLIMGLAVLPLPSTLISKCCTMAVTYIYSLIFGTLRYAVFLFILAKVSLLYMGLLFFALGPLVDFVYIVGIYSIHITLLSKKIKGDFTLWKWPYSY